MISDLTTGSEGEAEVPGDDGFGELLVPGAATGAILGSDVPLSFWGGVDPSTGVVIDSHHPLHGDTVSGKILVIPSGRGSCSGSGAIFEMLLCGTAPAALVFSHHESILTSGVLIASELFNRGIPVLRLTHADWSRVRSMTTATIADRSISGDGGDSEGSGATTVVCGDEEPDITLSEFDQQVLDGVFGEAARIAMKIVLRVAQLDGAGELVDVEMAHIDGVFYQGPASLTYATTLRDLGARVRVPSTMNAICVAVMTSLPACVARAIVSFCISGTRATPASTP